MSHTENNKKPKRGSLRKKIILIPTPHTSLDIFRKCGIFNLGVMAVRRYKKWSKEEVIKTIKDFYRRGIPLNFGYIAKKAYTLAYAARKYIGTWQEAVEAAGIPYEKVRKKNIWKKENIRQEIKRLAQQKKPLNISYAEKHYGGLVGAAASHFGSWKNAIIAAGLDYSKIKKQREWSREEVIKEIKILHKKGVNLTTTRAVRKIFRPLHAAAIRYFRSWEKAVRASGIIRE